MPLLSSRFVISLAFVTALSCTLVSPVAATTKKTPPPVRMTYVKGYTPTMIGDYPNASLQITVKDKTYIITAPSMGMAVSNVSVPMNAKNKDLIYISTMNIGGKNVPTSIIYEYNLKTKKAKQLFAEKNPRRELRVAGIDGNSLVLVQASQDVSGHCSSLWNGQYQFFTFDVQKPAKSVKSYAVSAALKKLGEAEEQSCKQSFGFKKT